MTREEFYKLDRGERNYYQTTDDECVLLPLTIDGFEALLGMAAQQHDLVVDDQLRSLLAGYIHHIPSDEHTLDFDRLSRALYKSVSNTMTFDIDQDAKKRHREKLEQKAKEEAEKIPMATVTPINP